MDKTTIIVFGTILNIALLVGIFYLHYFAPKASNETLRNRTQDGKGVWRDGKAEQFRIAIITPITDDGIEQAVNGVTDALAAEACFQPEIKRFDANGNRMIMRSSIEEAIDQNYDLIFTIGSQASQMAKELTEKRHRLIPIVFAYTGDPVRLELVDTLACSGNHLTGVTVIGMKWIRQMIDLLPVLAPKIKRVLIPYDPTGLGGALEEYKEFFDTALARHDIEVTSVKIFETNSISQKVTPFIKDVDMILVLPDLIMIEGMPVLAKLGEQYKRGIYVAQNLAQIERGAAMAFGYHPYDIGIVVCRMIRSILEDKKLPMNIPISSIEYAYRIGLNMESARKQGLLK